MLERVILIVLSLLLLCFQSCSQDSLIIEENLPNEELVKRNNSTYDVIILGAGAGGIGAAYALKDSGLKVLLIDRLPRIGGTHVNAWINVFAESVPPVFFESIVQRGFKRGLAKYVDPSYQDFIPPMQPSYISTYLPSRYTFKKLGYASSIYFDVEGLVEIYKEDFAGKIDILLNSSFVDIDKFANGALSSIKLKSSIGKDEAIIHANYFIDCTDGQIVRKINKVDGVDYFFGEDSKTRYLTEYGFTENNSVNNNRSFVNAATLIYRLERGEESLSKIKKAYGSDAAIYGNQDNSKFYVNSIHFLELKGIDVIKNGEMSVYQQATTRTIRHWASVKDGKNPRFANLDLASLKFLDHAPMLGVRETYRIASERMLNENSLYVKATRQNYNIGKLFDKIIAVGSHAVDIHGSENGLNQTAISDNMKPYGVPFGVIVPKKLKNVLIASKAAGMTHIAASSFRLNKNIMNLGYAAGKTIFLAHRNKLKDVRNISGDELLSEIEIYKTLEYIESITE